MKTFRLFAILSCLSSLALNSALAVPVTVQVNMSVQKTLGNFTPGTDSVTAAGTFNGWNDTSFVLTPSAGDTNIYTGTIDDTADALGANAEYKFIIRRAGASNWESRNNRTFTVASSAQVLDPVYFNDASQLPGAVDLTFRVNMSVQRELGRFNPETDSVMLAGTFNGWSPTAFALEQSLTDSNIYQGTITDTTDPIGTTLQYKFIISAPGAAANWETLDNRSVTLPATNTVLPVVYFNNLERNPGTGTPVTYQVDLSTRVALGQFDPATGTVSVAGAFNNWNTTASPLTNSTARPYIYSGTYNNLVDAPGNSALFKFVLNGSTWEDGANRSYTLSTNAQTVGPLFFSNVADLGKIALEIIGTDASLTFTNGVRVRLQKATTLTNPNWTEVPDTEGMGFGIVPIPNGPGSAFFRVTGP